MLVRAPEKERVPELDRALLTTDPEDVLGDASIDVFVEVMGGVSPRAATSSARSTARRSVVTANKMLLALHGPALVDRAVASGVDLAFEGSVGGGIPVIRVLRDALASDWVDPARGHRQRHVQLRAHAHAHRRARASTRPCARRRPRATPRPIPASTSTGTTRRTSSSSSRCSRSARASTPSASRPRASAASIPSITVSPSASASSSSTSPSGAIAGEGVELRVHPALVRRDTPLANVAGVLNAIALEGRALGPCLLSGRGAGDLPTAVSVVADVLDVARASRSGFAGHCDARHPDAAPVRSRPSTTCAARYYLRFQVLRPARACSRGSPARWARRACRSSRWCRRAAAARAACRSTS